MFYSLHSLWLIDIEDSLCTAVILGLISLARFYPKRSHLMRGAWQT